MAQLLPRTGPDAVKQLPPAPAHQPLDLMGWAIIALAFALRVPRLDARPLWFDEGYSIYFAGVNPLETARLTAIDIHPPLYYWALQAWTWLIGWNPVSVRFFSVFVGVLTVAALIALGKKLGGRSVGWLAGALLAASPLHVVYSQEVRMYALLALFAVLSMLAFARLGSGTRGSFAGYVAATAAALCTQYYAVFLVAGQGMLALLFDRPRRRVLAVIAAGLPLLLWAAYSGAQLAGYVQGKVAFEGYQPLAPWSFFGSLGLAAAGSGMFAVPAALALLVLAGLGMARTGRETRILLVAGIVPALVFGYLVNLFLPFHPAGWERLYVFVLPFYLLAAAFGIVHLASMLQSTAGPGLLRVSAVCGALLLPAAIGGLAAFYTQTVANDPRPMIAEINALSRPDDVLLAVYPWQIGYLRLYHTRPLPQVRLVPAGEWARNPQRMQADLADWVRPGQRLWFPAYQELGRVLEDRLEALFKRDYYQISANWFSDHRLLFYQAGQPGAQTAAPARFGSLNLMTAIYSSDPAPAGTGTFRVDLVWRTDQPFDGAAHLRLVDDQNQTWGQQDGPLTVPSGAGFNDRRALLVPAGTPPGTYRLLLSVTSGAGALNATDQSGAPQGTEIALGTVQVALAEGVPPEDALFMETALHRDLGGGLELLGTSFGTGPYRPGDTALVTLFWRAARQQPAQNATLAIGESRSTQPIGGAFPAPEWPVGQPFREIRGVIVRSGSGPTPLTLAVGGQTVTLGNVQVQPRDRVTTQPPVAITIDGRFGDAIRLVGATVTPGGGTLARSMDVQLVWQAQATSDSNLAVFVHLVDESGRPVAQHDSIPANGDAPVPGWVAGEYIVDTHHLTVPDSVPPGRYRLIAGIYVPPSGPRLPATAPGQPDGDSLIILSGNLL